MVVVDATSMWIPFENRMSASEALIIVCQWAITTAATTNCDEKK